MNQNKMKCIQAMDKIKRNLDNFGFSNIMTNDKMNILCKVPGDYSSNNKVSGATSISTSIVTTCPHSLKETGCPYTVCKYPNSTCHFHSNTGNDSSADNSDSSVSEGLLEVSGIYYSSLFRIFPTDIHDGLFLHVIKLHGETCDLKMTFSYEDTAIVEIINIIKFLVTE